MGWFIYLFITYLFLSLLYVHLFIITSLDIIYRHLKSNYMYTSSVVNGRQNLGC